MGRTGALAAREDDVLDGGAGGGAKRPIVSRRRRSGSSSMLRANIAGGANGGKKSSPVEGRPLRPLGAGSGSEDLSLEHERTGKADDHVAGTKKGDSTRWIIFYVVVMSVLLALNWLWIAGGSKEGGGGDREAMSTADRGQLRFQALLGREQTKLHLFTAPKPFVGADRENQIRALTSWTMLRPKPRITFLGDGEGYDDVARMIGASIDRQIDTSFRGMPLFSSMVNRANESTEAIAVLINSDILLFDDFSMVLDKVKRDFPDFLVVGARWDLEQAPNMTVEDFGGVRWGLVNRVRDHGQLHTYGGIDLWAWNTKGPALFDGFMPHFIYGRGKYDNWLTHEAITSGHRDVVDVSEAVTLVHVSHDYHLVVAGDDPTVDKTGLRRSFWNSGIHTKFELYINSYLAKTHGSYKNQMGTILHTPYKVSSCYERIPFCAFRRVRPHECRCEYSPYVPKAQNDPFVVNESRVIFCGQVASERDNEQYGLLTGRGGTKITPFGFPLQLEPLLDLLARDDTIVLTVLNFNDRMLLDNFVCNMRRLRITNFIVAALDDELYQYGVVRGLAVYLEDIVIRSDEEMQRVEAANHVSRDMYLLEQSRLRVTRRVLAGGRNIVYSDVDVLWLRDPLDALLETRADAAFLSNATEDSPSNFGLSAGFYIVHAGERSERFLDKAIALLEGTRSSDVSALYEVACGPNGEHRLGEDLCTGPPETPMRVLFLPRNRYVNGASKPHIWEERNIMKRVFDRGINILHNSGVVTNSDKLSRLSKRSALFVDPASGLCIHQKPHRSLHTS